MNQGLGCGVTAAEERSYCARQQRGRIQFMKLLDRLRHRRRAVARVLLPLLGAVWLGAPASPCLGMTAAPHDRVGGGAALHEYSHVHDQTAADGLVEGDQRQGERPLPHGACPHCLVADGSAPMGTHFVCSVLDDVSDGAAQPAAQKWDLKYFLPTFHRILPVAHAPPRRPPDARPTGPPLASPIPLNLRHCVFLI